MLDGGGSRSYCRNFAYIRLSKSRYPWDMQGFCFFKGPARIRYIFNVYKKGSMHIGGIKFAVN